MSTKKPWVSRVPRVVCCVAILAGFSLLAQVAAAKPGDLDRSFGVGGKVVTPASLSDPQSDPYVQFAVAADGAIVAGSGKTLARYLPDGSLDPDFGEGGIEAIKDLEGLRFSLNDLAVDPDGRIVVIGAAVNPIASVFTYYWGAMPTQAPQQ